MLKPSTILISLLISSFGFSQKIKSHIKSGVIYGAPIGPTKEGDMGFLKLGPSFGIGVSYKLNNSFFLEGELLLSNKKGGYNAAAEGDTIFALEIPNQPPALFPTTYKGRVIGEFNNAYLEFPISLSYYFGKSILRIGGYYAKLLSASHKGSVDLVLGNNFSNINDDFDDTEYLKRNDLGITFGGGFQIVKNQIEIGFSGTYGLLSIFSPDYPNVKDKLVNLYMFPYIRINMF